MSEQQLAAATPPEELNENLAPASVVSETDTPEVTEDIPADPPSSEADKAPEAATTEPEAEASEVSESSPANPSNAEADQAPEAATTEPEAEVAEVGESSPADPSNSEADQAPEATTAEPEASQPEDELQAPADPEDSGEEVERIGYTGDILGETIALSELNEQQEASESEQMRTEELTQLIDASLHEVLKDEIITGHIISVSDKDVVIDIGFKSDGIISRNEFEGEVNPGDTLEVYVERLENYHGQLQLSKERAEKVRRWERIEHAFENGTVLEGTIIRRIKGGMIVDLIDGLEAFLPGSQIDMRPVRDFDAYLDRRMEFKIVKINADNENVVVSHKALIERDLASQRESILSTMETGQVLEGMAKNITDFGVFVDLGGVDGLLHITDLTWGRVSHPTEVVSLDENLKVVVLDYDKERQRISLGLKQLQPHPWENIEDRYKPGDVVEGKVVSITDYGAFLEIEQGIEGLVHVSEMSWTGHIRHPSQRVSLGQIVKVSVLSIDHSTKKISLGMKQFETNPWEGIAMRYPPGTVLRGHVRNITHFGVFVEIEPGIDGLVHISDLSWTKTVRHPSELVKKRQEISVVVLDVDEKRQRIALGHKQIETNPWTNLATVYESGTDHKAKIVRVERKGLTVELPLEVEAFVPIRELKNKSNTGFPPYQEGDELELRVIRLDANQKEIVMSETAKQRQEKAQIQQSERDAKRVVRREEEKAVRKHSKREQATSGPTTIGELSGLESLKKLRDETS
ncbi:MAG: 30S ribosomal protein S1 [Bacteroidetes bacterium]|nr:30S ribosomal protein S1 [Bacteroidota bacterium]